jgi:uncharacterized protein (UPF0147 family)
MTPQELYDSQLPDEFEYPSDDELENTIAQLEDTVEDPEVPHHVRARAMRELMRLTS